MPGAEGEAPRLLLDTCAMIWVAEGAPLREEARTLLERAETGGGEIRVSPISAWEIGLLMARGRIVSTRSPQAWFAEFIAHPAVALAPMPPEVLIASSWLPGVPPPDPADRIIIATARQYGLSIMTRDARILDYAAAGHVGAVRC